MLMFTSKIRVFIKFKLATINSVPLFRKRKRGGRLMKKASLTAFLVLCTRESGAKRPGARVVSNG